MNIRQAMSQAREILAANKIDEAPFESELLIRHTLKLERPQLFLELDQELSPKQEETFWQLVKRRLSSEPTAYIIGHREFYGIDFSVNTAVLIPRPESELLVEKALELGGNYPTPVIADIGTGCGAIAVSLAMKLPEAKIYATDISAPALDIARFNCQKHGVADRVSILIGDMLDALPESVDMIVANLPYVSEVDLPHVGTLDFEPALALNGGPDGLEKIRRLIQQVSEKLKPGGSLLLEIGIGQKGAVTGLLHDQFPTVDIEVLADFNGIDRVVSLTLPKDELAAS